LANAFFDKKGLNDEQIEEEAVKILREVDWRTLWNKYSYVKFLVGLYKINRDLPNDKKIKLQMCDRELDWYAVNTADEYYKYMNNRDSVMAATIIHSFDSINSSSAERKKGFAILNSVHAFTNESWFKDSGERPTDWIYAGLLLKEHYGERLKNVLINNLIGIEVNNLLGVPIQGGKWDAAFKNVGNPDLGFDFDGSPFGNDDLDLTREVGLLNDLQYKDVFTGFVFYKPVNEHVFVYGNTKLVSGDFFPEAIRRLRMLGYFQMDSAQIIEMYNVPETFYYKHKDKILRIIDKWDKK
jgi:hypothetical protein